MAGRYAHGQSGPAPEGRQPAPSPPTVPSPMPSPVQPPAQPSAQAAGQPSGGSAVPAQSGSGWVAHVWVDPDWYATQPDEAGCPPAGVLAVVPLQGRALLIGRHSPSRGVAPDVDCGGDHGASRRHAQLVGDGTRWWIEDLGSANGTYVRHPGRPMPHQAIPVGRGVELSPGDDVFLGAWTRIELRHAPPATPPSAPVAPASAAPTRGLPGDTQRDDASSPWDRPGEPWDDSGSWDVWGEE